MKIGILQLNFTVGDFEGNSRKILEGYRKCCQDGAELVVGTELAIWGYPPRDQLLRHDKIKQQLDAFYHLVTQVGEMPLIIGVATPNECNGKPLFNSAAFIQNSGVKHLRHKALLPTYDVFDETRYFEPCFERQELITYKDKNIAILICEDIWNGSEVEERRPYNFDPVLNYRIYAPDLFVVLNV